MPTFLRNLRRLALKTSSVSWRPPGATAFPDCSAVFAEIALGAVGFRVALLRARRGPWRQATYSGEPTALLVRQKASSSSAARIEPWSALSPLEAFREQRRDQQECDIEWCGLRRMRWFIVVLISSLRA